MKTVMEFELYEGQYRVLGIPDGWTPMPQPLVVEESSDIEPGSDYIHRKIKLCVIADTDRQMESEVVRLVQEGTSLDDLGEGMDIAPLGSVACDGVIWHAFLDLKPEVPKRRIGRPDIPT